MPPIAVRRWLWIVFGTISAMIAIGGITRLTGSGLSMVEWRPLMGTLPPLGEAEWLEVFAKYQRSPQYQQVNHWMTLADFKPIFFWEYLHRLFGRLIGLATALPWLYFVLRRQLTGRLARLTLAAILLGGLQGLLGWYMVKSGLVDRPEVSHFRLAAHLSLAFVVGAYIFWILLDLRPARRVARPIRRRWILGAGALLAVQIVYGAFMAGTRAGYLFQTFPDLNGAFLPAGAFTEAQDLVANPVMIHFLHRLLAYAATLALVALAVVGLRRGEPGPPRGRAHALAAAVLLQLGLGIWTVMGAVPIAVATAHQVLAFWLLCALVAFGHAWWPRRGGALHP